MSDQIFQTARGAKDILPDDQKYWRFVKNVFSKKCEAFGYARIDTPIFEYSDIFQKSLGDESDIISKEMYEVSRAENKSEKNDKPETEDKRKLVLRPEMTAGVVRSYIQHGMKIWPQPVKLYYEGPTFRYNRPQAGRYRVFNQFGVELFGDADPFTDASLIFLSYQIMQKLGLAKDLVIDINSVGCPTCRAKMKKKLLEYFEKFLSTLCDDCNRRYATNPLRILDCKEEKCQRIMAGAPQLMDLLCTDCKTHFKAVLENLDILQVPYNLNPRLVRGLDYYTKTVFEFFDATDTGRQAALLGGGRYDGLLKSFGQTSTPAIGFAAGIERIIEKIKEKEVEIPELKAADICIVQIGEKAQKKCLPLVSELEDKGYDVACILGKESLKAQLGMAAQMRAKIALIIGQREVLDNSIIIRDMEDASQETVKLTRLFEVLSGKFQTK
ncbi:MAG: histidine--tRNA ligase [Candidatus Berkelbacteria bacterium]